MQRSYFFSPVFDYGFQKRCKGVHCVDLSESLKPFQRVFTCKIWLRYSRERAAAETEPPKVFKNVCSKGPRWSHATTAQVIGSLTKQREEVREIIATESAQKPKAAKTECADRVPGSPTFTEVTADLMEE